jgi:pyruvate dehydrogenase E2 component (dihydrolipoamide acetyltransferase)
MESGTIAKWRVKEGDLVKEGDVLIEVATDKATVEFNAIDKGYLRKILVKEGSEVSVNQPIGIFTEDKEESIDGYQPKEISSPKKAETKDKADAHEAPVKQEEKPVEASAGMQQPAFQPEPALASYDFSVFLSSSKQQGGVFASPYAKRLAKEKGVDLTSIKGSGPHGRVMSRDLDKGQKEALISFGKQEIPHFIPGSFEEEKLSPIRKIIGKRLQESKTFIPHFYVTQEIDAGALAEVREQLKSQEIKISFNDFIVRAVALSLRQHPVINSGYNSVNGTIIRFQTVDISIAVSIEEGLITPIVRHADFKNLGQISSEIKDLAAKAKAGRLQREEYIGGSFTVSNLGMFGINDFIGVINPPQAAILCVGGLIEKPVVKAGSVIAGKTMSLTLCSDHRVIDGADAAKFLNTLKKLLENPSLLVMG